MEKLALYGGNKAKTVPYGTGKRFGEEEVKLLREALDQNTLFYWYGNMTKRLCEKFAKLYNMNYCVATSSGTASIHVALGALGIGPGDEVITSPITDLGSVIGILYQGATPVFADLDPHTYNMTPESIAKKITDKTRAIIVVHLAGCAAEIDEIVRMAHEKNIYVIEDCAQSYCCEYKGKYAGTFGDIGCFSLNDFKHISAGDGGMVVMNDKDLYYRAFMFADKNYNRFGEKIVKNVPSLAPNYRMNELTAAVGVAQLDRVCDICAKRTAYGDALTRGISGIRGLYPHKVIDGCVSSYWFYMLRIDEKEFGASNKEVAEALTAEGVPAEGGYIPHCVYQYDMFKNKAAFSKTSLPFELTNAEYKDGDCPNAEAILNTCVRLTVNEFYTEKDLEETIAAIRKVSEYFNNK